MSQAINIQQVGRDDIPALYALYDHLGKSDDGFFEACFDKNCFILIARLNGQNVGFGILNFEPKYRLYQKLNIPEIQDLNVIPEARQQGIATALLTQFEEVAREKGYKEIGISVGLTSDYGPAQRLYIKQGYIPDGQGITHDRQAVEHGRSYPLDDDLALMMVKAL